MKLYYMETPNARKPCAVAKHLNSPVEYIYVDLTKGENKSPEFLAVNPNGKVPALADGDLNLWEGHAIMVHLAQSAGSDMWPREPRQQVDVLRWLNWDTAHFSRHANVMLFQNYIKKLFGMGDPDPATLEEAGGFFNQFATVLNNHLAGREFIVGDTLTVADFGVASTLPDAEVGKIPLDEFDEIKRWHNSLMQIPAWKEPYPAR